MPTTVNFNGTNYSVPNNREPKGWGAALTTYLIALGQNALAKSGGTFTLTGEVDFGATYGLVVAYLKSKSSNISTTGIVRFANNEGAGWRNQANSADKILKVNTSDNLEYDGNKVFDQSDLLDEDSMASNSATKPASQQSIKAYVDTGLSAKVNQTNPVLDGTITGTAFLDEDNMSSDSATKVASQQSIKAYVDTEIAAATGGGVSYSAKSADYTVLDGDGIRVIGMTTGSTTDKTVTLPTAADNTNRIIDIIKVDTGTNEVIIDGEGTELVGLSETTRLSKQGQRISIVCDGTGWQILYASSNGEIYLRSGNGHGSTNNKIRRYTTTVVDEGDAFTYADSSTDGMSITVNRDCIASITNTDSHTSASACGVSLNSASLTTSIASLAATEIVYIFDTVANLFNGNSASIRLYKNDVIRVHDDGTPSSSVSRVLFRIEEIERLG